MRKTDSLNVQGEVSKLTSSEVFTIVDIFMNEIWSKAIINERYMLKATNVYQNSLPRKCCNLDKKSSH